MRLYFGVDVSHLSQNFIAANDEVKLSITNVNKLIRVIKNNSSKYFLHLRYMLPIFFLYTFASIHSWHSDFEKFSHNVT